MATKTKVWKLSEGCGENKRHYSSYLKQKSQKNISNN